MTITIVGLGPGDPALVTRRAWDLISNASDIYVRTARHPTLEGMPASVTMHSFDHIYERATQFDEVYSQVAEEVLRLGGQGDVVYCVPGHPLVGESTVATIRCPRLSHAYHSARARSLLLSPVQGPFQISTARAAPGIIFS